ncbi:MAG: glycosyl transferase family protein [Gammaproteobacteria bacterium]|nr:glycosyl transferase family protein [Gammaproteobacteria bacterium]MDH5693749.1 glycosyl transferase family protein [Gammaproteobacteria bacterium]
MSIDYHPFSEFVRILGRGKRASRSLTFDEARHAMAMILRDEVEPLQLGAFLMLLRVKEETGEEIAGFVSAAKEHYQLSGTQAVDVDWSSYAGKRRQLPWFVLSARLLADQGIKILIHGTDGHADKRIYTRSVFEALGLPIAEDLTQAQSLLQQHNLVYLPLSGFAPRLQDLIELRPLLGLRSAIHTMTRLLNPLNAPHSIQSIFHPGYLKIHQDANKLLNMTRAWTIKGEGGEVEINPDMNTPLFMANGENCSETSIESFFKGFKHPKEEALAIDDLISVWQGEKTHPYGERAIIETCALILMLLQKAEDMKIARSKAETLWASRNP